MAHPAWGRGEVLRRDGDGIYAVFGRAGYRILSERLVREAGVLSEVPGKKIVS